MYEWVCKKCGSVSLHIKESGNNVGLYCSDCGAWLKWIGKDEQRAFERRIETKTECLDECYANLRKCSGYYTTREKMGWCKHESQMAVFISLVVVTKSLSLDPAIILQP